MSFIVTAGGHELSLRHPKRGILTATTMAHSLAQINRFCGHARRPYSVAEHSLLVCDILERDFGLGTHALIAGLLHDAHECVATDMHSPGKREIGQPWKEWEAPWQRLVRSEFALHTAATAFAAQIHQADLMALATERRDLLPPTPTPWEVLTGVQPISWARLDTTEREAMTWRDWANRFHDRLDELDFARNEAMHGQPDSGFTL